MLVGAIVPWDFDQHVVRVDVRVAAQVRGRLARAGGDPRLVNRLLFIETPLFDVSSTQIRTRLADGLSIRAMVPESIEAHISAKGLYAAPCS